MATNAELLARVYSIIGSERDTSIFRPMVLAMATLAYKELAIHLIDTDSEQAKKLVTSVANQVWASNQFSAPADMLFHKQSKHTRMDFGGTLAFQVKDRDTLTMIGTASTGADLGNHYYALEGKTFFIRHESGVTGASNLNLQYYKIPTISDIDSELMNTLLEILIPKLMPHAEPNLKHDTQK